MLAFDLEGILEVAGKCLFHLEGLNQDGLSELARESEEGCSWAG